MKKSRFTETQIVKILKEVESGRLVKEVCREHGISDATYYNWKPNTVAWKPQMLSGSKIWRKKIVGLNRCMPS